MDKNQLQKIFTRPFDQSEWIELLKEVFGAKQILAQPKPVILPNTNKANAAFELGSFYTADERVIGIYKVEVNPDVWLERNKVGLRELLRNVYQYDVDGALIVFEQANKWRLSFVSEIKVLDDEGEVIKQSTEPKRYTYLLGEGEKVLTPAIRLSKLAGKKLTLEDIRNAFSVEALNEEFYKVVAHQFYQLIGGTTGNSKNAISYEGSLKLPSTPKENRQLYQEFAVRLIGRTVFCWFLKVKKSENGEPLLPESLLSSEALKANSNYYHSILEPLFFQTLNTPMDKRIKGLPSGCDRIPFLNGGLFEYGADDFYKPNTQTGISANLNTLIIPDKWFLDFYTELEKYNFTIDENSVVDVEVSVDPEMLGRIFENLLAEIDPDSGETARKATGSFYTPREIVDYMASESLVKYLGNETGLDDVLLQPLFRLDQAVDFNEQDTNVVLDALDKLKILDPACGSGAFPMGVLQKIVMALQKLDPESVWWKERQVSRIENAILRKQVKEKLEGSSVEYARKIGIIQNSLFGVDIQPVAAEISKLRCFLTLIVDENIDETKENRGVEPLPNLEFKFVTADSLRVLPEERDFGGIFNSNDDLDALKQLRSEYLQSFGEQKDQIKKKFKTIQDRVYKQQTGLGKNVDVNSRAYLISTWNPFGHDKVDWFDPKWMFGVDGFNMVIGNPPYLRLQGIKATNPDFVPIAKANYKSAAKGNWDMYVLFTERGYKLLSPSGVLAYIQPHKFFQADFGVGIREYIADEKALMKVVHFGAEQVFNSATNYTCLFFLEKKRRDQFEFIDASSPDAWKKTLYGSEGYWLDQPEGDEKWNFKDPKTQRILDAIYDRDETLNDITRKIFVGLQTSADKIFVLKVLEDLGKSYMLFSDALSEEVEIEKGLLKPFLMGEDLKRYQVPNPKNVVIFPYALENKTELLSEKDIRTTFPKGWSYLLKNKESLERRENGRFKATWWQFGRPQNIGEFEVIKIMTPDIAHGCEFSIDLKNNYHTTTIYSFVFNQNVNESAYYWLGIFNSRLLWYFLQATGNVLRGGYFRFKTEYLRPFSVNRIDFNNSFEKEAHDSISALVRYVLILNIQDQEDEPINFYVPNQHLGVYFQQVIDGCVFELYFSDHLKERKIDVLSYVIDAIKKVFEKKIPTGESNLDFQKISELYDVLSHPDSPVKNRLLKFPLESPEILKPILQS